MLKSVSVFKLLVFVVIYKIWQNSNSFFMKSEQKQRTVHKLRHLYLQLSLEWMKNSLIMYHFTHAFPCCTQSMRWKKSWIRIPLFVKPLFSYLISHILFLQWLFCEWLVFVWKNECTFRKYVNQLCCSPVKKGSL